MPRMPRPCCGTTVICYSTNKNSLKNLENRLEKLEEIVLDDGPTSTNEEVYFYEGSLFPSESLADPGWTKKIVSSSIREEGLTYVYNPTTEFFPALAYPASWGALEHIHQGGPAAFDLLSVFEKTTIAVGDKTYWYYYFPESVVASKTVLTFLWKD